MFMSEVAIFLFKLSPKFQAVINLSNQNNNNMFIFCNTFKCFINFFIAIFHCYFLYIKKNNFLLHS